MTSEQTGRSVGALFACWGLVLLQVLMAVAVNMVAGSFREVYVAFGAPVAWMQQALISGGALWWLFPMGGLALAAWATWRRGVSPQRQRRLALWQLGWTAWMIIVATIGVIWLYVPIYELASV